MYKIIFFSLQLIVFIIILTFIFTNPFIISLDIGDLKYSLSSNIFLIIFIIALLILYFLLFLIFRSRLSINNYFLKNKYRKLEKGYYHFVEAMIAISNKDNRSAIKSQNDHIS